MVFGIDPSVAADLKEFVPKAIHSLIYFVGAGVLHLLVGRVHHHFVFYLSQRMESRGSSGIELEKQARTSAAQVRRILVMMVWTLAILMALVEFGVNVGPLLAGAGVAGIAVGFAAQSILKDWINGFFLITDGQLRINDIVKIGEYSGVVENISLRTVSLRGFDGALQVISNGSIAGFSNLTYTFSHYVFEIYCDYGDDPDRMMAIMRRVDEDLRADAVFSPLILEPLEISGVDSFQEPGVVIKARIRTLPSKQWMVGREFNRRLKQLCDKEGVVIARAQRAVQLFEKGFLPISSGSGEEPSAPLSLEQIRAVIREELAGGTPSGDSAARREGPHAEAGAPSQASTPARDGQSGSTSGEPAGEPAEQRIRPRDRVLDYTPAPAFDRTRSGAVGSAARPDPNGNFSNGELAAPSSSTPTPQPPE